MQRTVITAPKDMGNRLTEAMQDAGISANKLASLVGIDRRTLYAYMTNSVAMNVTICMKICAILKTTPNYLILGKE